MTSFIIRPAGIHDQTLLWCWRNDPVTRRMERIPGLISREIYAHWLQRMLIDDNYSVMIAETNDNALAVSYIYSRDKISAEIGICLNPAFRGQKLSLRLLEAFTEESQTGMGLRKIRAEVKMINLPSRRLFASAGYQVDSTTKDVIHFSLDLYGQEAPRQWREEADRGLTALPSGL